MKAKTRIPKPSSLPERLRLFLSSPEPPFGAPSLARLDGKQVALAERCSALQFTAAEQVCKAQEAFREEKRRFVTGFSRLHTPSRLETGAPPLFTVPLRGKETLLAFRSHWPSGFGVRSEFEDSSSGFQLDPVSNVFNQPWEPFALSFCWQRVVVSFCCLLLLCTTSGCGTVAYYRQAISGQLEILRKARPIGEVLADPRTPAEVHRRLEAVDRIREFAATELLLPTDGHYRRYADLGRPYVVWNVYAAPEFSVEPKTWWYPVVGHLEYRGYFKELEARRAADELRQVGWDVYVGGVEAYSTLGWLRDPLLNTMLSGSETELAELLFHELAHQKVFAPGDTDFNEAFATAVAGEGMRRWFLRFGDDQARAMHRAATTRHAQFIDLALVARARLEVLYDSAPTAASAGIRGEKRELSPVELRERKAQVFLELKDNLERLKLERVGDEDGTVKPDHPFNNAWLNTIDTYHRLVPAFARLLAESGGDLNRFYLASKRLARMNSSKRQTELDALLQR